MCKKNGLDSSKVAKYLWNKKRNRVNKIKIVKFTEALWRLIFYTGCPRSDSVPCVDNHPDIYSWNRIHYLGIFCTLHSPNRALDPRYEGALGRLAL